MGASGDLYILKNGFQNKFDCSWNKLGRWSGNEIRDSVFSKRTYAKLAKGGVPAKHLKIYLNYLADYVANKEGIRLNYSDMVDGPNLSWFESQAGSNNTTKRKDLQPPKQSHPSDQVDSSYYTSSSSEKANVKPTYDIELDQESLHELHQTVEVAVQNENNVDVTLQILNQPQRNPDAGGKLPSQPTKPLTSNERFRFGWLLFACGLPTIATAIAGIAIFNLLPRFDISEASTPPPILCGMIYVESLPAQDGSVRILRTGRSDNLRVLSSDNPGYFEFSDIKVAESDLEFRIDVDRPLDLAPIVIKVPANRDGSPVDIRLNIQPKSVHFPRKRFKDISPINDDVPPLNRMAILAYIGLDDEANRIAEEIEKRIADMSRDEKYEFFIRKGFCHWQANEFKQAATYYSHAMDISTSDFRHVNLAAESIRRSAAGEYFTEELGNAREWIDACREQIGRQEDVHSIQICFLNVTGAKLAIALGELVHGKNLLVHRAS